MYEENLEAGILARMAEYLEEYGIDRVEDIDGTYYHHTASGERAAIRGEVIEDDFDILMAFIDNIEEL